MKAPLARPLLYLLLALTAGCTTPAVPSATPAPGAGTTDISATRTPGLEDDPDTSSSRPRTIPLEAEALSGQTVVFWHVWDGERGALIEDLVREFNASNPYGVTVTAAQSRDISAEVATALQTGQPPDIAVGFNYHAAAWASASGHGVVDLVPYARDPVWGFSDEEIEDLILPFWVQASDGQRQPGLPFYRTAEVLLYNRTWAEELGFSAAPATPEELEAQVCAANAALRSDSEAGNDGYGGLALGFEAGAMVAWMFSFGGGIEPVREDEAYGFDRAENTAAFSFLRGLLDDGCAWVPESAYPHQEFADRLALILPTTLAGVRAQEAAMTAAGSADAWEMLPYPAVAGAAAALFYGPDLVLFETGEARQLAAWVFARWLAAPERQLRWAEATGYFPIRWSVLDALGPDVVWEWLPDGVAMPGIASWSSVQWVVSDLARVLFAPLTTLEDLPELAVELDALAEEVAGFSD